MKVKVRYTLVLSACPQLETSYVTTLFVPDTLPEGWDVELYVENAIRKNETMQWQDENLMVFIEKICEE